MELRFEVVVEVSRHNANRATAREMAEKIQSNLESLSHVIRAVVREVRNA